MAVSMVKYNLHCAADSWWTSLKRHFEMQITLTDQKVANDLAFVSNIQTPPYSKQQSWYPSLLTDWKPHPNINGFCSATPSYAQVGVAQVPYMSVCIFLIPRLAHMEPGQTSGGVV